MKKTVFALFLLLATFTAQAYSERPYIEGDSLYSFKTVPWKCIFTDMKTGESFCRYYTREGKEKARGTISSDSFCAMNQGPDNRDYYECYRTYKTGETRLVRNWYNYGADFQKKHNPLKYHYNPAENDQHGNWTYAAVDYRDDAYKREMVYYDEAGYNAEEDSLINVRINELVSGVQEQENPLNINNLAASAFALVVKALYLYGLFVLFMLVFMRQRFYLWFDKKAAKKITPWGNKLINKTLWCGLIPTGIVMMPVAMYIDSGHTTAVIHISLVVESCVALAIALGYCFLYVFLRGRHCSRRCARWELIYSISMWLCVWAGIIFSIYILFFALIALFFLGMVFGKGGSISSNDGNPDHMYATAWDTESATLNRLSGDIYTDNNGNLYQVSGGNAHRLGDSKNFSF